MKQLPSPEFRKSYPRLQEPVEVTALGRVIGTYTPVGTFVVNQITSSDHAEQVKKFRVPQAERDRILRRISSKS